MLYNSVQNISFITFYNHILITGNAISDAKLQDFPDIFNYDLFLFNKHFRPLQGKCATNTKIE